MTPVQGRRPALPVAAQQGGVVSPPSLTRVRAIDWLRGVAALLVCAGHLRAAFFVEWARVDDRGPVQAGLYFLTGLGHQAVMVFFVLSGYLVGGAVLKAHRADRFAWTGYLLARLVRLWVVLIPCLLLTLVIDGATLSLAPQALQGAYEGLWHSGPRSGEYQRDGATLLGNLMFMQTLWVPVLGSNGPLWRLAYEFWYYLAFPCLLIAWRGMAPGRQARARRLEGFLASLAMLAMWVVLPSELWLGFVIWLMGVAVAVAGSPRARVAPLFNGPGMYRLASIASGLLLVAVLVLSKSGIGKSVPPAIADLTVGLATAVFLVTHLRWPMSGRLTVPGMGSARDGLSNISYSLYLSHFPWVVLVGSVMLSGSPVQPSATAWIMYAGVLIALLAWGWCVWWLFERRTDALRRYLLTRLPALV